MGKFKLKPGAEVPPPPPSAPAAPPPAAAKLPPVSPFPPRVPNIPAAAGAPKPPPAGKPAAAVEAGKPPFVRSPRNLADSEYLRDEPAASNSPAAGIAVAVIVIMVGIGGFIGYRHFANPAESADASAPAPSEAPAAAPAVAPAAAPTVAAQPAAAPAPAAEPAAPGARAIEKTHEVLASRSDNISAVNELAEDSSAKPAASKPAEAPAPAPAVAVTPPPPPAPAVKEEPPPPPPPSAAFRAFVVNMRVSGVFQGNPARALINNQMASVGDTVDHKLGIVFTDIIPDKKQLIFTDATGAVMPRKY